MHKLMVAALAATMLVAGCKDKETAPVSRTLYPDPAQAQTDVAKALQTAAATHKRVLLDFGGNWCGDCMALDAYFHDPANQALLQANYVLVDVNIGHMDANLDIAAKYGVPLSKGVPALAVLDEHGQLIYSQKDGEFEAMRSMQPEAVRAFLAEWKPAAPCATTMVRC
jgi:thiol:disulfide interchange protein